MTPEKYIRFNPEYRVWGVVVENERHSKMLMLGAKIAIICGIIGWIGLISTISYFYGL